MHHAVHGTKAQRSVRQLVLLWTNISRLKSSRLFFGTAQQINGTQPRPLLEFQSAVAPPPLATTTSGLGTWNITFRANSQGGSENNPRLANDPDLAGLITNVVTGEPITSGPLNPPNVGRCQVTVRTVDVVYALASQASAGVTLGFRMSTCEPLTSAQQNLFLRPVDCPGYPAGWFRDGILGTSQFGRNVLFSSDSVSPVCVPIDCDIRAPCRSHSECPFDPGSLVRRFCASSCIDGLCPLPAGWETKIGRKSGPPIDGYGVCQDCTYCVFNDDVYADAGTASQPNCTSACAYDPNDSQLYLAGLCPGCNTMSGLVDAYVDGTVSTTYVPAPFNLNPAYKQCATTADCDAGLYCATLCASAISSLAFYPGLAEYCDSTTGTGAGFCQPCATGCQSDLLIRDNFNPNGSVITPLPTTCNAICGSTCPRCQLDTWCNSTNPNAFDAREFFLADPLWNYMMVANRTNASEYAGFEDTTLLVTGGFTPSYGPFPRSGCYKQSPLAGELLNTASAFVA